MKSDDEIVLAVLGGDTEAYGELVERYQRLIYTICLRQCRGDRYEAENLAQDAFLSSFRALDTYAGRGFKAWITRIAVNKCRDLQRHRAVVREELSEKESFSDYADPSRTPEQEAVWREGDERVRRLCEKLPPLYAQTAEMHFLEGKSAREIAEATGEKVKTVETRLYRAVKKLREFWKEEYS